MSFLKLGDRLRELVLRKPAPKENDAARETTEICCQGIRLYKAKADAGYTGFRKKMVQVELTGNAAADRYALLHNLAGESRWLDIINDLGRQFPGRVPTDPGVPRYERQLNHNGVRLGTTSGTGYTHRGEETIVRTFPPELWLQRAVEYAGVMDLLAELANERPPTITQPDDPHAPYMPAAWFTSHFGITANALGLQVQRDKLKVQKHGHWNHYSVPDAKRIWPELVTYGPDGADAGD